MNAHGSNSDPYTMDARLCDDDGMVSHERTPPNLFDAELTYLKQLNNLRAMTGFAPYDGEPFTCTGSAHLAREHIRCTSPAHLPSVPSDGRERAS